ncbi:MAG: flagellar protein FliS [Eubacterium sp.]|mgnify:FL=1|nr:flagellar protein FliS [Eubacterium sp.]
MKQEQVQIFTRRISQSNKSGLVVIVFDIIFAYMKEAKECLSADDYEGFKEALKKAQAGVDELIRSLDFGYEVSKDLYPLYIFVKEAMAKTVVTKRLDELDTAEEVLVNLHEAFSEAAKQDHSTPLMQNAQQVYAGMTYGRTQLNESFQAPEHSRGFLA